MGDVRETYIDENNALLPMFDPRILKYFQSFPITEETMGVKGSTPGIGQVAVDAAEQFNQSFIYNPLKHLGVLGEAAWDNLIDPARYVGDYLTDALTPDYSVNSKGQRVDPRTGEIILPSGQMMPGSPLTPAINRSKPDQFVQGGYGSTPPLAQPTKPQVQGGFSRALPPEVSFDVPPEYGKWAQETMQFLNSAGVDPDNILSIVKSLLAHKIDAEGQLGTSVEPISSEIASPQLPTPSPVPVEPQKNVSMQTWEPRKPTDWESQYEKIVTDLPKWSDLPQMTGLPEYKEPDYGGTLGSILRHLVYGAGMGAAGRDPVKADQERTALEKGEIEKRRGEMRTDITAQREFMLKRAEAINSAKLKGLEMRKAAEDKDVSDKLTAIDTIIAMDPTGKAANELLPIALRLRGLGSEDVDMLKDPQTGKLKVARSPTELEEDKFNAGLALRKKISKEVGVKLGWDNGDVTRYEITGKFPDETDTGQYLEREIKKAYVAKNIPLVTQLTKDLQVYQLSKDTEMIRENYRYTEGMKDLANLEGKISEELRQALIYNLKTYHYTGKSATSQPRSIASTTLQKLNPMYQEALDAMDPEHPERYAAFTALHNMEPPVFIQMFDTNNFKVGMPANAVELAISRSPYGKLGSKQKMDELLDELRYEASAFAIDNKKGTPVRDQWIIEAEPHVRAIYGKVLRRIEEDRGKKLGIKDYRLTPEEVADFYARFQVEGIPKFAKPVVTKTK